MLAQLCDLEHLGETSGGPGVLRRGKGSWASGPWEVPIHLLVGERAHL